jgi:hypothetical protein
MNDELTHVARVGRGKALVELVAETPDELFYLRGPLLVVL